jgi:hypothetical protein
MNQYYTTSFVDSIFFFLTMACVICETFQIVMTLTLGLRPMQGAWKGEG